MPIKSLRKIKSEVICPPKVGELVEGKIINRSRNSLYLDLGAKGIGVIFGQEFYQAKSQLKDLKPDDSLFAKVIGLETDEGYRELSFSQANQEIAWRELENLKEKGEVIEVLVKGANKGGLICPIKGVNGFLPSSQLLPENYPKVRGADPSQIAAELQKLVGKKVKVKILDVDTKEQKLILSEKASQKDKAEEELQKYQPGDVVEGEISGLTSFGAFLKFGNELEGLVQASEVSEEGKTAGNLKIGQKIKAKILEKVNNRIYLSLKNVS